MARVREFDVDQALERAMNLFWRKGYAATSLQDLLAELGIGSGSLYAAFGSKEGLYARALERYCAQYGAGLGERLDSAADVRSGIRAVLTEMAETDLLDPVRGCMAVNAVTERDDDPATTERVAATLRTVESALAGALERAQARGEIPEGKNTAELARFLTTFIQGLRVTGQARLGRGFTGDSITTALAVLD